MNKPDLYKSPVVFTEEPHGYHLGEKKLSGITNLIHQVLGLGVYPDASDYVKNFCVPRAGEYGTSVHHAIEAWDNLGIKVTLHPKSERFRENPFTDLNWEVGQELESYIRNQVGFVPLANEYTVSDEKMYASNIDNVWIKNDTQGIWLIDTKTNNLSYYPGGEAGLQEYLSWQLSVYACLFERQNPSLKVEGLACNWLRKADSRFWIIERKPDDEVAKLLATEWAEVNGHIVFMPSEASATAPTQDVAVQEQSMIVKPNVVQAIYDMVKQAKEAEEKLKALKSELKSAMQNAGIKSWDSGLFKATIGADSTTTSFDTTKFKKDHPELYKQYSAQKPKAGSFTITLKEDKSNQ
ncbi:MAG: siphovirus Gp157 family protein [Bacteroidales bacterium]|nr:siphovirus Gp157 family protein [Bacteroidales bacterium]